MEPDLIPIVPVFWRIVLVAAVMAGIAIGVAVSALILSKTPWWKRPIRQTEFERLRRTWPPAPDRAKGGR